MGGLYRRGLFTVGVGAKNTHPLIYVKRGPLGFGARGSPVGSELGPYGGGIWHFFLGDTNPPPRSVIQLTLFYARRDTALSWPFRSPCAYRADLAKKRGLILGQRTLLPL